MKALLTYAVVLLIGIGLGVPLGARYEYDAPLPEPTESQTRTELVVCMATMVRATEALDTVEALIRAQGMRPIGASVTWNVDGGR